MIPPMNKSLEVKEVNDSLVEIDKKIDPALCWICVCLNTAFINIILLLLKLYEGEKRNVFSIQYNTVQTHTSQVNNYSNR